MPTAVQVVSEAFENATGYADSAKEKLELFTDALRNSIYAPPSLSVTWASLPAPSIDALPATPSMPTISFTSPVAPTALALTDPTVTITEFTEPAPTVTIGPAPTLTIDAIPTIPSVTIPAMPVAPVVTMPDQPVYLALSTPTFAGVDLRADYLTKLENIPDLVLASPTPYSYSPGPEYASTLLTTLKGTINTRLAGGTGLSNAVEQAIWDRAKEREISASQANITEVSRASEALGFNLPAGVIAAQLRAAQQDYYDKISTLSRDISIKQAELEQENLKQTISQGMELEGRLIDYSYKLEALTFESAKEVANNALQIHNAMLDKYKTLLSAYQTYASVYKTIIDGELAKIEVYKAQLSGEQTKASINTSLVQQYKATIEASMATVEIYKAQIGAASALVEIEKAKLGVASEQIRAYVAGVNAQTSRVEAYKATVQAEGMKVDMYKTKAQAFSAVSNAQGEAARLKLGVYTAKISAKNLEWDGFKALVSAESTRIQALGMQSNAMLDGYRAAASAIQAKANMTTKVWETKIRDYEAGQTIALQAGKINADLTLSTNAAKLDAAKTGAQVYAQLTSSAYSMIHASAGISASGSTSVSYSYSNETESKAPMIPVW